MIPPIKILRSSTPTHTCVHTRRWYLRDRSFDVEEAEEKLTKMLIWRRDFQWVVEGAWDSVISISWQGWRKKLRGSWPERRLGYMRDRPQLCAMVLRQLNTYRSSCLLAPYPASAHASFAAHQIPRAERCVQTLKQHHALVMASSSLVTCCPDTTQRTPTTTTMPPPLYAPPSGCHAPSACNPPQPPTPRFRPTLTCTLNLHPSFTLPPSAP